MHLNIYIKGKVQGVWYRKSTKDTAENLGLYGFVQNQADGSVYVEVEGPQMKIQELLKWCEKGPAHAKVLAIETEEDAMQGFRTFEIRR